MLVFEFSITLEITIINRVLYDVDSFNYYTSKATTVVVDFSFLSQIQTSLSSYGEPFLLHCYLPLCHVCLVNRIVPSLHLQYMSVLGTETRHVRFLYFVYNCERLVCTRLLVALFWDHFKHLDGYISF